MPLSFFGDVGIHPTVKYHAGFVDVEQSEELKAGVVGDDDHDDVDPSFDKEGWVK